MALAAAPVCASVAHLFLEGATLALGGTEALDEWRFIALAAAFGTGVLLFALALAMVDFTLPSLLPALRAIVAKIGKKGVRRV